MADDLTDKTRTSPAWIPLAAAAFVLIPLGAAILSERGRSTPAAIESMGASGTKGQIAAPQLPEGYEPVDMKDLIGPYPRAIRRKVDGARFLRVIGEPDFELGAVGGRTATATVHIPDLYVQESEVTNAEFARFLEETDTPPPAGWASAFDRLRADVPGEAGRHPAVALPHGLAAKYAAHVAGGLPTGAEWEYVARSGGRPDRPQVWPSDDPPRVGDNRTRVGRYEGEPGSTAPVMSHTADRTAHGVFDLVGNVREWCADEVEPGRFEVRGGSWATLPAGFSTVTRQTIAGEEAAPDLGFRVVIHWPRR